MFPHVFCIIEEMLNQVQQDAYFIFLLELAPYKKIKLPIAESIYPTNKTYFLFD